jgi:endonuclease III
VRTKEPDETQAALKAVLPERFWMRINALLVAFGRTICVPVSPRCSTCPLGPGCPRIGVGRSR